ncbi:uncharacterized protein Triagg1_4487 [Trichoderma aggressivum f. europaeum]|uniref:NADP-dependent oxidoreductase domain-containing protein n=1 Tax=Trichoderma aggressivum f. europaeum TaxID=173218 RepID=A0AAE1IGQ8_9HYPO|nr:hypothetical protein Triagg1_4487 [Trichoderma aggressivum f. europaeum]
MDLPQVIPLNNGYNVPAIGLGTFQGDEGNSKIKDAVKRALQLGYRHIDGASAYGNEKEIGEAIKESGIPRHEIFVTSKLAQTWHEPADVQKALELSLSDLQLDYVDLYLMHFYPKDIQRLGKQWNDWSTWVSFVRLVRSYRPICEWLMILTITTGLSNFNILKTKRILDIARIVPAVNQVEIHPYLPQQELFEFSSKHGILLMAHQPLGGRPVEVVRGSNEPFPTADLKARINEIAAKYKISSAQVCLSWAVQKGIPAVPKSVQDSHMEQNLHLKRLSDDDFRTVDQLSSQRGPVRFLDPSRHLGFDIFDEDNDQPVADRAPWDL